MKKLLANHEVRYVAEKNCFATYLDGNYTLGSSDYGDETGASVICIKETDFVIEPDSRLDVAAVTHTKSVWRYA